MSQKPEWRRRCPGIWQRDAGGFSGSTWTGPDEPAVRLDWGQFGGTTGRSVLERRVMLGDALGIKTNPLGSAYRASTRDVVMFLEESLDDSMIEDLQFAFTLVDWRRGEPIAPSSDEVEVWPIYALLKHLFLAQPVAGPEGDVYIVADLNLLATLRSGDVVRATQIAVRRLQKCRIDPHGLRTTSAGLTRCDFYRFSVNTGALRRHDAANLQIRRNEAMDWTTLETAPRVLFEANLRPAQGERFQPTGFADLGAAQYTRPDGTDMLLVESAQSVANRLERTCLDGDGPDLSAELVGLPYVAATLTSADKPVRTSSLVEAHRIGSPYFLLNKKFKDQLAKEMKYNPKRLLDWKAIYSTLFRYDPNSLVHGAFLALLEGGRVRTPLAVTGFIEAANVKKAISCGVKNSPVDPKGELHVSEAEAGERGVYSNVPYSRIEFTAAAETIKAYFNIDLALTRGYGLPPHAPFQLLTALALLKVRRFLSAHLRLRTACDFQLVDDVRCTAPVEFQIPDEASLLTMVQSGIKNCKALFADPPVTELKRPR